MKVEDSSKIIKFHTSIGHIATGIAEAFEQLINREIDVVEIFFNKNIDNLAFWAAPYLNNQEFAENLKIQASEFNSYIPLYEWEKKVSGNSEFTSKEKKKLVLYVYASDKSREYNFKAEIVLNRKDEKLIYKSTNDPGKWEFIIPDTTREELFRELESLRFSLV